MERVEFREPGFARFLFASPMGGWVWLVPRLYLGYEWFTSGFDKVRDSAWISTGEALQGFALNAASLNEGPHPAVNYGWYADFLRWIGESAYPWMAKVITIGELLIGAALLLGAFTGIAAFFGGMLSFSFGLAGVAGVNPVFFLIEVILVLAWRNAGWIGLDRWLLPALGTPWQPGRVFTRGEDARSP